MLPRSLHPSSLSRRVFLAQGALAVCVAPASLAQSPPPDARTLDARPFGPAPLTAEEKGPCFTADGAWILTPAEIAALPAVTVAQVRLIWRDGRTTERARAIWRDGHDTEVAMIDARWHRDGRPALRPGIPETGFVGWAIDPATQRWDFARPVNNANVSRKTWLVLFGQGPDDPAPALAVKLLQARGYDRVVWMREGIDEWNRPPKPPAFRPLS